MPYSQGQYESMDSMKYYGGKHGSKGHGGSHGGRYKYDKGYGYGHGVGKDNIMMERGNDYNKIQDKIASSDRSKLKSQMYHQSY